MGRSPPTEQKKDAVREQAWRGRRWETNEAKQEQSSLGAPAMRSDQARVASSREDTGGLGGRNRLGLLYRRFCEAFGSRRGKTLQTQQ